MFCLVKRRYDEQRVAARYCLHEVEVLLPNVVKTKKKREKRNERPVGTSGEVLLEREKNTKSTGGEREDKTTYASRKTRQAKHKHTHTLSGTRSKIRRVDEKEVVSNEGPGRF